MEKRGGRQKKMKELIVGAVVLLGEDMRSFHSIGCRVIGIEKDKTSIKGCSILCFDLRIITIASLKWRRVRSLVYTVRTSEEVVVGEY